jgi:hypothetical protein
MGSYALRCMHARKEAKGPSHKRANKQLGPNKTGTSNFNLFGLLLCLSFPQRCSNDPAESNSLLLLRQSFCPKAGIACSALPVHFRTS